MRKPIEFIFVIIGLHLFFKLIFRETDLIKTVLEALVIYDVYWMLYSVTPAVKELLYDYSKTNSHLSYELTSFIMRILKLLIIIMGLISILYNFGVNVTAFMASLGLGGLAFALAAKDTAANLFGSIALMLDRSIRIGEWIRVNGVEGTVEDIGMRTTKIRTFEKSFVVVPNSIVANSNIENFSRRGIRRIKTSIGLTYDTTEKQIKSIVNEIREMMGKHPGIAHDQIILVRFEAFNASDLGIIVYAFTNTSDWEKHLEIKEDVYLKIMQIVEKHEASFAFPSQSLYIEQLPEESFEKEDSVPRLPPKKEEKKQRV
jgi:MscS family membrane protein